MNELYVDRKIQLCISDELVAEYTEVLKREKFARVTDFIQKASWILKDIREHSLLFHPQEKLNIIKDPDDNMLLELAVASSADFLITGNTNDFTISAYESTKIVNAREYWELYR